MKRFSDTNVPDASDTTALAFLDPTPIEPPSPALRALLWCGVGAGPTYLAVAAAQVVTREGFDLRHHAVSLLSNGPLGWVQITNFVLTGVLTIAGAVGLARAGARLRDPVRRVDRVAVLIGVYGASLVAAGVLVADPASGFPVGTPDGPPAAMSWQGAGHLIVGSIGFLALVAACVINARWAIRHGARSRAVHSAATGVLFLAAFLGIASGTGSVAMNLAFTGAVVVAWTWISLLALMALRTLRAPSARGEPVPG